VVCLGFPTSEFKMNVFITGGLSGLGMDLSHRFLDDGHTVGVCDLQSDVEAEQLLKVGIQYFQADVWSN